MGNSPRYHIHRVVGRGQAEQLVSGRVDLPRAAAEILEIRKNIYIDAADATMENVILQGRVHSRYLFPVMETGPLGGSAPEGAVSASAAGPLWTAAADLRFHARIPVTGARPGMQVTLETAHVSADATRPAVLDPGGAIRALLDQSLVQLCVRVTDETEAEIEPAGPPAPPKAEPKTEPEPPHHVQTETAAIGRFQSRSASHGARSGRMERTD